MASKLQAPRIDGHKLQTARLQAGLTLVDLAKQSGISRPAIRDLERGHRNGRPATHKALADALQVEIQDLYAEDAD